MSKKLPPIPPASRSPYGPGGESQSSVEEQSPKPGVPENLHEQGRQGNIAQNTHNKGYQQDR
jgi:hypothetical protein